MRKINSELSLNKGRIHWIDIARGICIIAIVIGHTYHNNVLRTYTLSFDVPMFFFLSGILYKYPTKASDYFKKKLKTIVVPYFMFSILSIVIFWLASIVMPKINNMLECSIWKNILVMLYGNSKPDIMKYYSPLWFLTCYFSVIVLSYLIDLIYDKMIYIKSINKHNQYIYRIIIILVFIALGWISSNYFPRLPWHFETAVSMLVWFELGKLVNDAKTRINGLNKAETIKTIFMIAALIL